MKYGKIPLVCHRTGQVLKYQILWIMRRYLSWPKFLQVIFCYCSYTWTVKLIRGVLHLYISFICWFRVISFLFCIIWSCNIWRGLSRSRGQQIAQCLMYRLLWRPFWSCPWNLPVWFMKLLAVKIQTLWSWDYCPQVLDYEDSWFYRHQNFALFLWCRKCKSHDFWLTLGIEQYVCENLWRVGLKNFSKTTFQHPTPFAIMYVFPSVKCMCSICHFLCSPLTIN